MIGRQEMYIRPRKSLGQNFLTNEAIAIAEAAHAIDKNVLELGPGYGVLTRELCKNAKRVVAVEKDSNLYLLLKNELHASNLRLVNKDFFEASREELELDSMDIMIANIPYKLSSRVMEWLLENSMQAVLCLQKEFVDHMLARCDTDKYSKLSVVCELCFSLTRIMDVSRRNFIPVPRVDSSIVYIKPKPAGIAKEELNIIRLLMQHKKKKIRNAMIDSRSGLGMDKPRMVEAAGFLGEELNRRVFKLSPYELLEVAKKIRALQKE